MKSNGCSLERERVAESGLDVIGAEDEVRGAVVHLAGDVQWQCRIQFVSG